jgi:hypothetical protein
MGYGLSHPNGDPMLGLRLGPCAPGPQPDSTTSPSACPDLEAIEQLAARLTALGDSLPRVHWATIGRILPDLHDPGGHEVRSYTVQQHTGLPGGQVTTITNPRESAQRRERAGT